MNTKVQQEILRILVIIVVMGGFVLSVVYAKHLFFPNKQQKVETGTPQITDQEKLFKLAKDEPIATILAVQDHGTEFGKVHLTVTAEAKGERFVFPYTAEPRNNVRFETDNNIIFVTGDRAKMKIVEDKLVFRRVKNEPASSP